MPERRQRRLILVYGRNSREYRLVIGRLRDLPRTQNRVQPRVCDCVCSRFDQRVLRWTIALIKDGEDLNDGIDLSFEKA